MRAFEWLRQQVIDLAPDIDEAMVLIDGIETTLSNPRAFLEAIYQEIIAAVGEAETGIDDLRKNYEQNGLTRDVAEQLVGQGLPILLSVLGPKKV